MDVKKLGSGRRHAAAVVGLVVLSLGMAACSGSAETGTAQAAPPPPAPLAKVAITAEGGDQVNPKTPIVIKATDGTLNTVTITNPQTGNHVEGDLSADKTTWTSKEPLRYGASYDVVAAAVNKDGKPTEQKGTVKTLAAAAQVTPQLIPSPGGLASYGVGQVVGVNFGRDITDRAAAEKSLTVTTNPPQAGSWYWLNKREAHYRPKDYWQAGTTIKLAVNTFGVNLGDAVYGAQDRAATYQIHDSWIGKADGGSHQMQILHNGQPVKTMNLSMGAPSDPTHLGPHVVAEKLEKVEMNSCSYGRCPPDPRAYDVWENWASRISASGEYVHENTKTVGVQGSANVSNGCINLNTADAKWFFDNFNTGDVVEVTNSGGQVLKIDDGYGDWAVDWASWQAGSALKG